jgi:hypothetical protein
MSLTELLSRLTVMFTMYFEDVYSSVERTRRSYRSVSVDSVPRTMFIDRAPHRSELLQVPSLLNTALSLHAACTYLMSAVEQCDSKLSEINSSNLLRLAATLQINKRGYTCIKFCPRNNDICMYDVLVTYVYTHSRNSQVRRINEAMHTIALHLVIEKHSIAFGFEPASALS